MMASLAGSLARSGSKRAEGEAVSRRAKLIEKMEHTPGNIRFAEVAALLRYEGFVLFNNEAAIAPTIMRMGDSSPW